MALAILAGELREQAGLLVRHSLRSEPAPGIERCGPAEDRTRARPHRGVADPDRRAHFQHSGIARHHCLDMKHLYMGDGIAYRAAARTRLARSGGRRVDDARSGRRLRAPDALDHAIPRLHAGPGGAAHRRSARLLGPRAGHAGRRRDAGRCSAAVAEPVPQARHPTVRAGDAHHRAIADGGPVPPSTGPLPGRISRMFSA